MALEDIGLKAVRKQQTKTTTNNDDKIKGRASLIINIFAALLAFNTFLSNSLSSTIMNNTIKANNLWNFYQAKSMKQTMYELAAADADTKELEAKFLAKAASYESEPLTNEGKKELYEQAKQLEEDRDVAKKKLPWIAYANTAYQLAIVVLTTSIISASVGLFYGSLGLAVVGILLMTQGIWLWIM
jgi:Domain of unknown function (DUF4337)